MPWIFQSGAGGPGWLGLAIATTRGPKLRRAGPTCWPTDAARARAPNGVGAGLDNTPGYEKYLV